MALQIVSLLLNLNFGFTNHYIGMGPASKCTLHLLAVLSTSSTAFLISLAATVPALGWEGFGRTYQASTPSDAYLMRKHQVEMHIKFGTYYITALASTVCLLVQNLLVIRLLVEVKRLQQKGLQIDAAWSSQSVRASYLFISLALLFILPTLSFYLSLIIERKANHIPVHYDWIIIFTESFFSFSLMAIIWIVILKASFQAQSSSGPGTRSENTDHKDQIENHQDLFGGVKQARFKQEKPIQTKSTFGMEGASEMYETIKQLQQDLQQRNEKILFSNTAIPLFAEEAKQEEQAVKNNKNGYENNKAKNQLLEQIQRRKKRFRELNPLKQYAIQEECQDQDQQGDFGCKLSKLPKSYTKYIRQAKRPNRIIPIKQKQNTETIVQKLSNSLPAVGILDNPRIPSHLKQRALGHVKQEELVYQKIIKAKPRSIKPLFEELRLREILIDGTSKVGRPKIRRIETQEQKIMSILKRKYSEQDEQE